MGGPAKERSLSFRHVPTVWARVTKHHVQKARGACHVPSFHCCGETRNGPWGCVVQPVRHLRHSRLRSAFPSRSKIALDPATLANAATVQATFSHIVGTSVLPHGQVVTQVRIAWKSPSSEARASSQPRRELQAQRRERLVRSTRLVNRFRLLEIDESRRNTTKMLVQSVVRLIELGLPALICPQSHSLRLWG
jgi:hypothetical protein